MQVLARQVDAFDAAGPSFESDGKRSRIGHPDGLLWVDEPLLVERPNARSVACYRGVAVAATYRALGDKAAYVRQRGFEPLPQEQMVLQYVERHGRITRAEVADLCRLSTDQAYRLLTRLTEDGRLVQRGSKKGAWYERSGPS